MRDQNPGEKQEPEQPHDPDANLSKEEIVRKYERRLANLLQYPTLDKFPLIGSQWGVKPKGFEKVTAQRAKLSGLFPLPGAPRPVDVTKLEGLLKDGSTESGVLLAVSKIDPLDSRNSCIVLVKNIDFLRIDYLKVSEYINKFICSVDLEGTSLENNIEKKRKTRDDKNLIIEFKNNTSATLALTLSGRKISSEQFGLSDSITESEIVLELQRPGEYVVQCLPPYDSKLEDVADEVVDSPRKLTLYVDKSVTETMLTEALTTIAPLKAFKLLREVGTKESTGIAFAEFFIDPKKHASTKSALTLTSGYVGQAKGLDLLKDVQFSCITMSAENGIETSVQDCPIELKTLKALVRNEYVPFHPKLRVIQLINIVTAAELTDDTNFKFIQQDILEEAKTFGNVVSIKIPRPPHDYTPGILHFNLPGLGKVYIEFDDEKIALNAIMGLGGRSYNDKAVLCAFFSHEDYRNGLL